MEAVASLCIRVARPFGLMHVLECAAKQDFREPWELVVVDWMYEERREVLEALWKRMRPDVPLVHVPPLPPHQLHDGYNVFDICTSFNTAFAAASGRFLAHTEDYWVFHDDWFRNFVSALREHPNFIIIGDKRRGSTAIGNADMVFDEAADFHYGVQSVPPNAGKFAPLPPELGRGTVLVNFGHRLEPFLEIGGLQEWPTRWPETYWGETLQQTGLNFGCSNNVTAWHIDHLPGFAIVRHLSRFSETEPVDRDGVPETCTFLYEQIHGYPHIPPERPLDLEPYRRHNLAQFEFVSTGALAKAWKEVG